MASDDTTTVLDEANAAAVRLMVERLADHDVIEVFNLTGGLGPVADLAAEQMKIRELDY
ncbi:hypothetical protein H5J25_18710 (plasmid) [Sphingomonas aliaeris]|jgi:hypothetical protein|uniref:Uncharacterized protein n=1 Tax=Sphingomonas aliaeris TaxID=2759526 RepID=A0A974NYX9_9SPHN|nr:hypothetical protein [Sphingomonas aliaeris]QQV79282.1 hypothetical protein H5J25_18710 [Sphingomonas aliaeris]